MAFGVETGREVARPSHLKIPGGPKMARAALSRRAIHGPNVSKLTCYTAQQGDACLASRRVTYGPYRPQLEGPFRRAKNGPSQMRRPIYNGILPKHPQKANSFLYFYKRSVLNHLCVRHIEPSYM